MNEIKRLPALVVFPSTDCAHPTHQLHPWHIEFQLRILSMDTWGMLKNFYKLRSNSITATSSIKICLFTHLQSLWQFSSESQQIKGEKKKQNLRMFYWLINSTSPYPLHGSLHETNVVTAALIVEPSLSPMNILQRRPVVSNISSRLAILNAVLYVNLLSSRGEARGPKQNIHQSLTNVTWCRSDNLGFEQLLQTLSSVGSMRCVTKFVTVLVLVTNFVFCSSILAHLARKLSKIGTCIRCSYLRIEQLTALLMAVYL